MFAVVLTTALIAAGCSRDDGANKLVLDGSPRFPDVEGVVEQISLDRITLDGDRSYKVAQDLASFSTYDLTATPMLHRKGQYVQLGLDGKTARWMAGIGVVVRAPGKKPVVFYNGSLQAVQDGRAIFRNGTVLTLAKGIKRPGDAVLLRAEIDPTRHVVRALIAI